jgi:TolA-binding protein
MTTASRIAPTEGDCAEDLVVLDRRRLLTEPEQRRLNMCLASSESLRMLQQIGQDFDEMPAAGLDDLAITERLVTGVGTRFGKACVPPALAIRTRRLAGTLVAAALLIALGAAATRLPLRSFFSGRSAKQDKIETTKQQPIDIDNGKRPVSGSASQCQPAGSVAAAAPGQDSVVESKAPASLAGLGPRAGRSKRDRGVPTLPLPTMSSADLFSEANAARRQGDLPKATQFYRRLQSDFPQSEQAALSYVLLARIALGRGAAGQALQEFEAYLRQVPGGSLEQEALQGKAQALGRLDRHREEIAAWSELLRRFPSSVYAPSAREHLGESQ